MDFLLLQLLLQPIHPLQQRLQYISLRSSFLRDGVCIAIDPYLSDSLTHKYATTNKPHVRMTARVVDPALLAMVSVVTSSHNHTDHLDAETIVRRSMEIAAGICIYTNREVTIETL